VIAAQWYAREGKEDEVARLARLMIPHSRSEAGCRLFIVNRSADDPRKFLLYEQFEDKAAFEAHTRTEPFKAIVLGQIVPLLESRVRDVYDLIEP
jgi:(4S)-4-hydroxy-5-phosphonooxypentane-2,3-dione isomerase